jgi:hypothetical protein
MKQRIILEIQVPTSHEQDKLLTDTGFKDIQRANFRGIDIIVAKK